MKHFVIQSTFTIPFEQFGDPALNKSMYLYRWRVMLH